MRRLKKIATTDRELDQVQSNADDAISELQQQPVLNGRTLTFKTTSGTGDVTISHGLNRPWVNYIASADEGVSLWTSSTPNKQPDRQIILVSNGAANVTLFIF